jgi:polysaccharide export outer membrane protein
MMSAPVLEGRCSYPLLIRALFLGLFLASAGCSRNVYHVSTLPREFLAPSAVNVEAVNLAGLHANSECPQVIQRGDVLDVSMVTDFTKLTTTIAPLRVGDDGTVAVPLVGKVAVAGSTMEEAERTIAAAGIERGVYRTPCVTVTFKEQRKNRVTVVGAVQKPGTHELPRGSSSLLNALVAAEGLSKEAGPEVEIRRSTTPQSLAARGTRHDAEGRLVSYEEPQPPPSVKLNLAEAAAQGQANFPLEDGDVVHVARRAVKPIYVMGLVRKPGELPYPGNQDLRVLDAIAVAGGCSNPVADKVVVIRQVPVGAEPVRIELSLQEAKDGQDNLQLAPGDTMIVEQTAGTVVIDTLQNFFRFGFTSALPIF